MSKTKLLDAQGIAVSIANIAQTSSDVMNEIHQAAVSCLAHVRDHGDTTLAVRLLAVAPSGLRRNALAQWFKVYSSNKLSIGADKNGVWSAKLNPNRTEADFRVDDSMEVTFGDLMPEAKVKDKPMTLEDLVKVIAKFTKNDKTLKDGTPVVGPDLVKAAQKALSAITA
ncbi:MAG: hypothetical protein ACHQ9S_18695 [Candidatus Binatia bacterium]